MSELFKRTSMCGTLNISNVDPEVILNGWVAKRRNLGGLIFIDLRDKTGIVQVTFDDTIPKEIFDNINIASLTSTIGSEFSIREFVHYGEISEYEFVPISKINLDMFALVQVAKEQGMDEQKIKQINEKIEDQNVKKYKVKNKANILPDYTKKIKKLLDLNKPKKELIDTLVDKIVIDKDRNITICFKYDIVPEVTFKYENRNLARNPYGRKGKKF